MTEIYRNGLIYGISYALDYVEHDLVMIAPHHSKRVGLLSALVGRAMGYENEPLLNLAVCGALHDNALTEYEQIREAEGKRPEPERFSQDLGMHCTLGEENISKLPFYHLVPGAVLYHHENADGSGPFGKTAAETPVFAQLIHIADTVDAQFDLSVMSEEKFREVLKFVAENTGTLYEAAVAEAFAACFTTPEKMALDLDTLDRRALQELPEVKVTYSPAEVLKLADFFAKIIDFKSKFTFHHSEGAAEKAAEMAEYYGWNEELRADLYLAGALHDVGKLMVRPGLLEKPGKLTDTEFEEIKKHAYWSYVVLQPIKGLEEVAGWAYNHHEKLDGTGYPFGRRAPELGHNERLMGCLDIYQALREDRPYRGGMSHAEAMKIMQGMVRDGKIDAQITDDIDQAMRQT